MISNFKWRHPLSSLATGFLLSKPSQIPEGGCNYEEIGISGFYDVKRGNTEGIGGSVAIDCKPVLEFLLILS